MWTSASFTIIYISRSLLQSSQILINYYVQSGDYNTDRMLLTTWLDRVGAQTCSVRHWTRQVLILTLTNYTSLILLKTVYKKCSCYQKYIILKINIELTSDSSEFIHQFNN